MLSSPLRTPAEAPDTTGGDRFVYFVEQLQDGERMHRGVLAVPTLAHLAMSYHEAVFKTSDCRPFPLFFQLVTPAGDKTPIESSEDLEFAWNAAEADGQSLKFAVYRATNPGRKPTGRWYLPMRNAGALEFWLMERQVDMSLWGISPAKSVVDLLQELRQGKVGMYTSRDDARPQREVHIVRVKVFSADRQYILMQRRKSHKPLSLVATSVGQGESVYQAAKRTLWQKLQGATDVTALKLMGFQETVVEEEDSESYPGLCTRYVIETMLVHAPQLAAKEDFTTMDLATNNKWRWTWTPLMISKQEMEKRRLQQSREKAARHAQQEALLQQIAAIKARSKGSPRLRSGTHSASAANSMSMRFFGGRSGTQSWRDSNNNSPRISSSAQGGGGPAGLNSPARPVPTGPSRAEVPVILQGNQTIETVRQWLEARGVNTSNYGRGQAKPLEKLVKELAEGESVLVMDLTQQPTPYRVTSVAKVRVRAQSDEELSMREDGGPEAPPSGEGGPVPLTVSAPPPAAPASPPASPGESKDGDRTVRAELRSLDSGMASGGGAAAGGGGGGGVGALQPMGMARRRSTLGNQLFLVETHQHIRKGDAMQIRLRYIMLSEKVKVGEHSWETAVRGIHEELHQASGLSISPVRLLDADAPFVEWMNSPSYPGLMTKYVLHSFDVAMDGLPQQPFLTTEGPCTHFWDWWTLKELADTKDNLNLQVEKYLSFNEQFNPSQDPTDSILALVDFAKKAIKSNDASALRHCLNTMDERWGRELTPAERVTLLDLAVKHQAKDALEAIVLAVMPISDQFRTTRSFDGASAPALNKTNSLSASEPTAMPPGDATAASALKRRRSSSANSFPSSGDSVDLGTLLYYAARVDHVLLVQRLVDEGAPPMFACLKCAVSNLHCDVLEVLLPLWRPMLRTDTGAGEVPRPCKHGVFQWTTQEQLDDLLQVVDRTRDLAPPEFAVSRRSQGKQFIELMSLLLRQRHISLSGPRFAEAARNFLLELARLNDSKWRRAAVDNFVATTRYPLSNILALIVNARAVAAGSPFVAPECHDMTLELTKVFCGILNACASDTEGLAMVADFHEDGAPHLPTRLLIEASEEGLLNYYVQEWYAQIWLGEGPPLSPGREALGAASAYLFGPFSYVVPPVFKAGALVLSHGCYCALQMGVALAASPPSQLGWLSVFCFGATHVLADVERALLLRRAVHELMPFDLLAVAHLVSVGVLLAAGLHRDAGGGSAASLVESMAVVMVVSFLRFLQALAQHPRMSAPLQSWRIVCEQAVPHLGVLLALVCVLATVGSLLRAVEEDCDSVNSLEFGSVVELLLHSLGWSEDHDEPRGHRVRDSLGTGFVLMLLVWAAHLFACCTKAVANARPSKLAALASIHNARHLPNAAPPLNLLLLKSSAANLWKQELAASVGVGASPRNDFVDGNTIADAAENLAAIRLRAVATYFASRETLDQYFHHRRR